LQLVGGIWTPASPASGGGTNISTACGITGGPITTSGTLKGYVPTQAKSNGYTIADTDCGALITVNSSSASTLNLPQAGSSSQFQPGWFIRIQNLGAGAVTVNAAVSLFFGGGATGSSLVVSGGQITALVSDGANYDVAAPPRTVHVYGATFDGGGSALIGGTNVARYLTAPFACTIISWDLLVDTGTATFKLWKVATGTAIPTSANSINTNGVAISSGTALHSTALTDFTTTTISANDIIGVNLSAASGATLATLQVQCQ
jgi:hypothetical protein